jgi:hypothetical protein
LLERWSADVIAAWKVQWEAQSVWEAAGGHTLSWAIREHLRNHGNLQTLITPQLLTAYPSLRRLKCLTCQAGIEQSQQCRLCLKWVIVLDRFGRLIKFESWLVIVCSKDISQEQTVGWLAEEQWHALGRV